MTPRWWLAPSMKFRSYTSVPYLLGNRHGMMTYITVFCVVACYICLFSSSSFFLFFSFLSSVLCGVSCACVCLVCVWKERGKEMFIKSGVITTEEEAKCMLCKASLSTRNGRRWPDAIVCVCVCVCVRSLTSACWPTTLWTVRANFKRQERLCWMWKSYFSSNLKITLASLSGG